MKRRLLKTLPSLLRGPRPAQASETSGLHPDEDPDLLSTVEVAARDTRLSPRFQASACVLNDQPDRLTIADDILFDDEFDPEEAIKEVRPQTSVGAAVPAPSTAAAMDEPVRASTPADDAVARELTRPEFAAGALLDDWPDEDGLDELELDSDVEIVVGAPLIVLAPAVEPDAEWLVDDLPEPKDLDDADLSDDVDFGLDLEEYDQPPLSAEAVEPDWRIDRRAAQMIWLLPEVRRTAGDAALSALILLLEEFPHGSSHAAIQRLAEDGASLHDLTRIAGLKRFWSDDSGLWLQRRFDPMAREWRAHQNAALRHAMTWRLGRQLLKERDPMEVQDLLCGEWLDEWMALSGDFRNSDGLGLGSFYTFPQFIAQRTEAIALLDEATWPYEHAADDPCYRTRFAARWNSSGLLVPDAPSPWTDRGALSRVPLNQRAPEEV